MPVGAGGPAAGLYTSRMGVWIILCRQRRILSGPHRIRTMCLGGIIWQQYGGRIAAGSHWRQGCCHGGMPSQDPPPNFPMLMAVPKGQMHLQAEPVSMGSCPPVIKSISSAVRCLASHPGPAPHLRYNFRKLPYFCKPHYLCLEREREYHSLVRKGNESIYFLECEHDH